MTTLRSSSEATYIYIIFKFWVKRQTEQDEDPRDIQLVGDLAVEQTTNGDVSASK